MWELHVAEDTDKVPCGDFVGMTSIDKVACGDLVGQLILTKLMWGFGKVPRIIIS